MRITRFTSAVAAGLCAAALSLATAAAQETPQRGGTFIVTSPGDPQQLIPVLTSDLPTLQIGTQIFSPLISVGSDQKIRPDLAESWEKSADGLTYTFHLVKNAQWHDGKPVTSADVKYSFENINRKYNPQGITGFSMVKSFEAPDPYTVVITLAYPFPAFFPWSLTNQWVLPKHIYEGSDPNTNPANAKPVGSGPFVFKQWVRGSYILLERNPRYYKAGKPYIDRLVYRMIPDASARVAALETGDVDHLNFISMPTTAVKRLRSSPNVTVKLDRSRANYGIIIAQINVRNEPLKKKEVRQAIYYAIDQKEIITKALDGIGEMSTGPISPQQTQWYNPNVRKYEHDPKLANEMLDKAGYPRGANGTRFPLRIAYDRNAEGGALQSAAEIMREDLRAVGIELQLKPLDGPSWMEQTAGKWDYDISVGSFQTGPDPAVAVSRLYITKNIGHRLGTNTMGYSNPKVDELFATSEREIDETKRKAELDEVQALLVEELPSIWLWAKVAPIAYRKYVHGDLPAGTTHNENFDSIWLSDKKK